MTSAHELSAFARVEPISLVRLNAAQSGIVSGLRVLPGERVAAGERLGALQGPEIDALLARRRGAVVAAQGELAAARESRGDLDGALADASSGENDGAAPGPSVSNRTSGLRSGASA